MKHNKYFASTKLMDLGEKGKIHSNIPSIKTLKVIDVETRKIIGEVWFPIDEVFALAGKAWRIVKISKDKL